MANDANEAEETRAVCGLYAELLRVLIDRLSKSGALTDADLVAMVAAVQRFPEIEPDTPPAIFEHADLLSDLLATFRVGDRST